MMTTTVLSSAVATCDEPLVSSRASADALLEFRAEREMSAEDSLQQDLQLAADCDVPVLVSGADVGQAEHLARSIHRRSVRRDAPFVVMDARQRELPIDVLTLLRRVASGETSDHATGTPAGGTLFIAHVEKMSFAMQIALLRFLDRPERRRRAGLRIITASDASAVDRVASGQFRAELYYRLNVMHIAVSPGKTRPALRALLD
jgi:transcriptional regulator of aroF, aroG, tyrA and aromatic amino acid transport